MNDRQPETVSAESGPGQIDQGHASAISPVFGGLDGLAFWRSVRIIGGHPPCAVPLAAVASDLGAGS
jgi:hypothetical protein